MGRGTGGGTTYADVFHMQKEKQAVQRDEEREEEEAAPVVG